MYTHVYIRINKVIVRVIHFLESNFRNKYFVGGGGGQIILKSQTHKFINIFLKNIY